MKKLMSCIALTASVWSSFSFAQNYDITLMAVRQGSSYQTQYFTVSPNPLTVPTNNNIEAVMYYRETVTIKNFGGDSCYFLDSGQTTSTNFRCGTYETVFYLNLSSPQPSTAEEPSKTCNTVEGAFIDGFHNALEDFCAIVGTTGGANPQPLMCTATNISEIPAGSGNFQHTVTAQTCTAPTGPTAPDGEGPDPEPCSENCEPTDPPPTGGNDGSDIPNTGGGSNTSTTTVTGTSTDSQGNVTNIEMTFEQDLTPVTERLNEANQRLKVENQNSSTIIDKLNELITGNTNIGQKLDGIKDAINGLDGGTDMSGVEDGIEGLREDLSGNGSFAEGEALAGEVSLPSETDLLGQFQAIQDAINSPENQAHFDALQNAAGNGLTVFESIPQLFQLSSESCTPLPFYKYNLDICGYTSTIRTVLNFVFIVILIIFLVRSLNEDMKKIRMIS